MQTDEIGKVERCDGQTSMKTRSRHVHEDTKKTRQMESLSIAKGSRHLEANVVLMHIPWNDGPIRNFDESVTSTKRKTKGEHRPDMSKHTFRDNPGLIGDFRQGLEM